MSWLGQLWHGMSPCMSPGVGDCEVWWEAWAAVAGGVGVFATIFLGVFTYRLGMAANRASRVAIGISKREAQRQRRRDRTERLLVLVQIAGEVSTSKGRIQKEIDHLATTMSKEEIATNPQYRIETFKRLDSYLFPICDGVTDRLHYLERETSSRLLRATNMFRSLQGDIRSWGTPASNVELADIHKWLAFTLLVISDDLDAVSVACKSAVAELGLDDGQIAAKVMDFQNRVANN